MGLTGAVAAGLSMLAFDGVPGIDGVVQAGVGAMAWLTIWMLFSANQVFPGGVLFLYLGLADGYVKLRLNTEWATLLRDVLLYALAAGMLARMALSGRRVSIPPLGGLVLAFVAVVVIQVFNPVNDSIGTAVASTRPHIEFVPLFFIGYAVMRTPQRLRGFFLLMLFIASVNGLVSLVQFTLPPEQLATWGSGYEERIKGTGDVSGRGYLGESGELRTRPFGLGADAGFGGFIGMLCGPAALALLMRGRRVLAGLPLAAGVVLALATSLQRTAIVGAVIGLLTFLVLASVVGGRVRTLASISLAGVVGYVMVTSVVGGAYSGAFERYRDIAPGQVVGYSYSYRQESLSLIPEYAARYPLGAGLGSVGPAVGYTENYGTKQRELDAENEFSFLLLELGLPGALMLLWLNVRLLGVVAFRLQSIRDREARMWVAAGGSALFGIFGCWFAGIMTSSSPMSPYFWFVAGIAAWWLGRPPDQERDTAPAAGGPRLATT